MLDALIRSKVKFLFSQKSKQAQVCSNSNSNPEQHLSLPIICTDKLWRGNINEYVQLLLSPERVNRNTRRPRHESLTSTWSSAKAPNRGCNRMAMTRFAIPVRANTFARNTPFRYFSTWRDSKLSRISRGGDFYLWPFEMITTVFSIFSDSLNPWYSSNTFFHAIKSTSLSFDNSSVDSTKLSIYL